MLFVEPRQASTSLFPQALPHLLLGAAETDLNHSGGAIGAGLFVSSGGAFQTGGPGAVVIGT